MLSFGHILDIYDVTIASVSRVLSRGGSGRPRLQMPPGCGESSAQSGESQVVGDTQI